MTKSQASIINTYAPLIAPGLLLLFLLITSIRPISLGYDIYNDKRILEIATLILVNLTGLFSLDIRKRLYLFWQSLPRFSQFAIPGFFLLGTVSALQSSYPLPALADVAIHLSMLTAGFVIISSYLLRPKQVLRLVTTGIILLVILSSFIEFIGFITHWLSGIQPNSHSMYIYFSHPRFFNQIQSWLLPLIFLLPLAYPEKRHFWVLSIIAGTLWWALLFFSGGRGATLGLLIALFLSVGLCFYLKKIPSSNTLNKKYIQSMLISLLLGVFLFVLLISIPSWFGLDTGSSLERTIGRDLSTSMGRFSIWSVALTGLYDNYWLGIGPGLYSCLTPADYYPAHPHNGYLQILTEWGGAATLLLTALIIIGLTAIFRNFKNSGLDDGIGLILFAGLTAAAVHMTFSGLWVMPASQISMVLLVSVLAGYIILNKQTAEAESPRYSCSILHLVFIFSLLSQLLLIYFISRELPILNQREPLYSAQIGQMPTPGFWQEGRVCHYKQLKFSNM